MAEIHVLDKKTIDQIAAGEVVERPVSVVKEMVENSIDAHADAVTVEIKSGGTELIRITDNGEGIAGDQIAKAFAPHATSKILQARDLASVQTLGFRGEALSSISAVSRVELVTRQPGELTGTLVRIEGGDILETAPVGAPEGSTFVVRDLFFNVPARKKFLKAAGTEAGYISAMIEHIALSHPEISFKYIQNGQTRLHTSGNNQLKDVIYNIYGREAAKAAIPVACDSPELTIRGFVGNPSFSRGNRDFENYYINGRFIRDSIISKAIEEAFAPYLMQHRYPFTCIMISMDPSMVDVNVHPAKREVRFSDPVRLYEAVKTAVDRAVSASQLIPEASPDPEREVRQEQKKELSAARGQGVMAPEPFEKMRRSFFARSGSDYQPRYGKYAQPYTNTHPPGNTGDMQASQEEAMTRPSQSAAAKQPETSGPDPHTAGSGIPDAQGRAPDEKAIPEKAVQMDLFEDGFLEKDHLSEQRIIGQLFGTYWLVEYHEQLFIIDQHAAHEKIIYEQFVKRMKNRDMTSQQVSPPVLVSLSRAEENLLGQYMPYFEELGFEISHFGGRDYAISAVPDNLYGQTESLLFTQMLDSLSETASGPSALVLYEKLASMSCKAAIKGNTRMSREEAQALIAELMTLENPYRCPHGRPTIISMSKYEIEKKFKRIV